VLYGTLSGWSKPLKDRHEDGDRLRSLDDAEGNAAGNDLFGNGDARVEADMATEWETATTPIGSHAPRKRS
jgi:hypothetical protein